MQLMPRPPSLLQSVPGTGFVAQPTPGMLVYYFRRSKGAKHQPIHVGYRGPERVLALEPSTVRKGTSVVWLSHGGNLIRCAPEHLRYATDLEKAMHETTGGALDITQDLRRGQGRQFVDMGEVPSAQERQEAEGTDGPNPGTSDWTSDCLWTSPC